MRYKQQKIYTIKQKKDEKQISESAPYIAVQTIRGNDAFGFNANGEFCRVDKNKLVESTQEEVLIFSYVLCLSGYVLDVETWDIVPLNEGEKQLFNKGDILQSKTCDKMVKVTRVVPEHKQYHVSNIDGSEIETEDLDYDCRDKAYIEFDEQYNWFALSPKYVKYIQTHEWVNAHLPWWFQKKKKEKVI